MFFSNFVSNGGAVGAWVVAISESFCDSTVTKRAETIIIKNVKNVSNISFDAMLFIQVWIDNLRKW